MKKILVVSQKDVIENYPLNIAQPQIDINLIRFLIQFGYCIDFNDLKSNKRNFNKN